MPSQMMASTPEPPPLSPSQQATHRDEESRKSEEDLSNSNVALGNIEKASSEDVRPPVGNVDPYLVEFDGPDDPDNPKNWTENRRWGITVAMGLMVFTVTFASSIFSVNIGYVQQHFNVDLVTATLGVSLFVLVCQDLELSDRGLITNSWIYRDSSLVQLHSAPCQKFSGASLLSSPALHCSPSSRSQSPLLRMWLLSVLDVSSAASSLLHR